MIRLFIKACKAFAGSTDIEDPALVPNSDDLPCARCPRCKSPHKMARNGSYRRRYVTVVGGEVLSTLIKVSLVRCRSCGSAHALLPSTVVPCSPFSTVFISRLIIDRLDLRFSSIAMLCEHYQIAVHTYYRIYDRFSACVRVAYGIMAGKGAVRDAACLLSRPCQQAAQGLLSAFFERTGTSFCQPRGP